MHYLARCIPPIQSQHNYLGRSNRTQALFEFTCSSDGGLVRDTYADTAIYLTFFWRDKAHDQEPQMNGIGFFNLRRTETLLEPGWLCVGDGDCCRTAGSNYARPWKEGGLIL
jgi:hypothetical protein